MSFDNSWAFSVQDLIFSKLKARLTSELKTKYKDLNVTTDGRIRDDIKLPTVYIQFVNSFEYGHTLEGNIISAVNLTIQTNVNVSKKQGFKVAHEIECSVINAMKDMFFNAKMEQIEFDNDEILTSVMRFDRIIGHGDKI